MKAIKYFTVLFLLFACFSCEELTEIIEDPDELTESEIVQGLKTALLVGTDSSVTTLSLADGYFLDNAVKILLPPEANDILDNIENIKDQSFIGDLVYNSIVDKTEDLVLRINRSAEAAATVETTKEIFVDAITEMSFENALNILQGVSDFKSDDFDSLAATHYFIDKTYDPLTNLFSPIMNNALDQDFAFGISTNELWGDITTEYNGILEIGIPFTTITVGSHFGYETVNTDIGEFVTGKALDGLFLKVGEEEKKIRKNPLEWVLTAVGDILERVFTWFNED